MYLCDTWTGHHELRVSKFQGVGNSHRGWPKRRGPYALFLDVSTSRSFWILVSCCQDGSTEQLHPFWPACLLSLGEKHQARLVRDSSPSSSHGRMPGLALPAADLELPEPELQQKFAPARSLSRGSLVQTQKRSSSYRRTLQVPDPYPLQAATRRTDGVPRLMRSMTSRSPFLVR